MVIVLMLTSWNKPNYLPIRQWAFIKTSLRNANFFMGIFLRATSALCSLLYVWACEVWTCLFSGPMMIHLDLSTEFKFSHVHLFIAFSRRAVFCLFVCLFVFACFDFLVAHNRSFLPQSCWVQSSRMSQDQAVLKPERINFGKLVIQRMIQDLFGTKTYKSLGEGSF